MKTPNKTPKLPVPVIIFIAAEAVLYILFMILDGIDTFTDPRQSSFYMAFAKNGIFSADFLKYYSVILCLAVSIIYYYKTKTKESAVLTAAMFFTAFSDYFLLLDNNNLIPGMLSFCVVHTIYLFVITNGNLKQTLKYFLIRIAAAAVLSLALRLSGMITFDKDINLMPLIFLVILYGFSFISNIFTLLASVMDKTKKDKNCLFDRPALFLIGLTLFILCDLNVLIYNLGDFINISSSFYPALRDASYILMWGFYLPSQVVIVLSCILRIPKGKTAKYSNKPHSRKH